MSTCKSMYNDFFIEMPRYLEMARFPVDVYENCDSEPTMYGYPQHIKHEKCCSIEGGCKPDAVVVLNTPTSVTTRRQRYYGTKEIVRSCLVDGTPLLFPECYTFDLYFGSNMNLMIRVGLPPFLTVSTDEYNMLMEKLFDPNTLTKLFHFELHSKRTTASDTDMDECFPIATTQQCYCFSCCSKVCLYELVCFFDRQEWVNTHVITMEPCHHLELLRLCDCFSQFWKQLSITKNFERSYLLAYTNVLQTLDSSTGRCYHVFNACMSKTVAQTVHSTVNLSYDTNGCVDSNQLPSMACTVQRLIQHKGNYFVGSDAYAQVIKSKMLHENDVLVITTPTMVDMWNSMPDEYNILIVKTIKQWRMLYDGVDRNETSSKKRLFVVTMDVLLHKDYMYTMLGYPEVHVKDVPDKLDTSYRKHMLDKELMNDGFGVHAWNPILAKVRINKGSRKVKRFAFHVHAWKHIIVDEPYEILQYMCTLFDKNNLNYKRLPRLIDWITYPMHLNRMSSCFTHNVILQSTANIVDTRELLYGPDLSNTFCKLFPNSIITMERQSQHTHVQSCLHHLDTQVFISHVLLYNLKKRPFGTFPLYIKPCRNTLSFPAYHQNEITYFEENNIGPDHINRMILPRTCINTSTGMHFPRHYALSTAYELRLRSIQEIQRKINTAIRGLITDNDRITISCHTAALAGLEDMGIQLTSDVMKTLERVFSFNCTIQNYDLRTISFDLTDVPLRFHDLVKTYETQVNEAIRCVEPELRVIEDTFTKLNTEMERLCKNENFIEECIQTCPSGTGVDGLECVVCMESYTVEPSNDTPPPMNTSITSIPKDFFNPVLDEAVDSAVGCCCLLSCGHTMCYRCFFMSSSRKKVDLLTIKCPQCRQPTCTTDLLCIQTPKADMYETTVMNTVYPPTGFLDYLRWSFGPLMKTLFALLLHKDVDSTHIVVCVDKKLHRTLVNATKSILKCIQFNDDIEKDSATTDALSKVIGVRCLIPPFSLEFLSNPTYDCRTQRSHTKLLSILCMDESLYINANSSYRMPSCLNDWAFPISHIYYLIDMDFHEIQLPWFLTLHPKLGITEVVYTPFVSQEDQDMYEKALLQAQYVQSEEIFTVTVTDLFNF